MFLKTEIQDSSQKVLIVAPHDTVFLKKLKKRLKEMHVEVFSTSSLVDDYEKYDICFFIQFTNVLLPRLKDISNTKFVFVLFNEYETSQTYASFCYEYKLEHIKILNLETSPQHYDKDLDTIFWFAFSRTEDIYLHIFHQTSLSPRSNSKKRTKKSLSFSVRSLFTPKKLMFFGILMLIFSQFLFLPPLLMSSAMQYAALREYKNGNSQKAEQYVKQGKNNLQTSKNLYSFSKPILHFFSIALPFEDLLQINTSAAAIMETGIAIENDGRLIAEGIFEKNKNNNDIEKIADAKERLVVNSQLLHEHIVLLEAKLPEWNTDLIAVKEKLREADESLAMFEQIIPHFDSIFAKDTEKKYLLLFANNMELRPGGGFIGSYAVANVRNYTIQDIQVYDVYDADGQLTAHIEPPEAISKFMEQPFWYLRDSAFTGDFVDNFHQAEEFLAMEVDETSFDGGLLLTATAVKNLLATIDSLYIPDFRDTITADNFYIKAQLYAEDDFFPGSLQKKSFLSSVMDQMLLHLPDAHIPTLTSGIQDSLNQKQLVLYSKDPAVQEIFEKNFWSGRTLLPSCTVAETVHCIPDYLYQLDANLGVNKANFFIQRPSGLKISIDSSGTITNTLTVQYKNDSHQGVFPGGTYKNYFQVMIPSNSYVQSVTVDGAVIDDYDETNFTYKTIGFLMTVPPQEKREVRIIYRLPTTIIQGNGTYQLILQKQIGSPNYDFHFSFEAPDNIVVTRHNLSPLAESDKILYNTSVSSDKIFLIEFSKN